MLIIYFNFGYSYNYFEFQYCPSNDTKIANEVKEEQTEEAVAIRKKLLNDLRIVDFLLTRMYAAKDLTIGSLLQGMKNCHSKY